MSKVIFYIQTAFIFLSGGCLWKLSRDWFDSYWASVPLFVLSWFVISYIGLGLISLCSPKHRLAAKLNIKIENLPIYEEAFNKLVEAEMRGEDTQWIGDQLPDEQEWLRYLQYELSKGLRS